MKPYLTYLHRQFRDAPRWGRRMVRSGGFLLGLLFVSICLHLLFPLPAPKVYSQTILSADSTLICAYLSPDDKWRMKTHAEGVSEEMKKAILVKEDRWFYYHPGINPFSVVRAMWRNSTTGRRTSGASTLTMQLARMAAPAHRTYGNKIREMFRALQYEWCYSKQEILEMYLSYLPYGGNIEGVHSAAYLFFDRPPEKLSLSQAILLAVIPNRPNSLRLDLKPEAAIEARNEWIDRFLEMGTFPKEQLEAAREEKTPGVRYALEPQAPQFCYQIREKITPETHEAYTTLDLSIQQRAERLLKNHSNRVQQMGVSNGAVLILDNRDNSVVAYCGSADFFDDANQGQVDGIQAIRSPGSTLKPAAYGMGFDLGLITPKNKMLDVPTTFHGFRPENYDMKFNGETTVEYALTHSLNIPPVRLVQELSLDLFLNQLESARFETIRKKRPELGLSVVLGGCGVSLEELTRFYSSFAREGRLYPLAYFADERNAKSEPVELFSASSAYLIADILSELERPDLPQRFINESRLPRVAWKTGTSYGRRDAWSIGFSPRYTVGVWMGNFSGKGIPELSGTHTAVPLLLDIFNAIDYDREQKWFYQPPGVAERKVCSETGMLPGPDCTRETNDYYLRGISSLKTCDLYEPIYVSHDHEIQYCPVCLPDSGYEQKSYPIFAPELAVWYESQAFPYRKPPAHNPLCEGKFAGAGPAILSPSPELEYYIEKGSQQQILLQAASEATVSRHYWYVNDRFIGEAASHEKLFVEPSPGKMRIVCMDDKGRKSRTEVAVKVY